MRQTKRVRPHRTKSKHKKGKIMNQVSPSIELHQSSSLSTAAQDPIVGYLRELEKAEAEFNAVAHLEQKQPKKFAERECAFLSALERAMTASPTTLEGLVALSAYWAGVSRSKKTGATIYPALDEFLIKLPAILTRILQSQPERTAPHDPVAACAADLMHALDSCEAASLAERQSANADDEPGKHWNDRVDALERLVLDGRATSTLGAMAQIMIVRSRAHCLASWIPDDHRMSDECSLWDRQIDRALHSAMSALERECGIDRAMVGGEYYMERKFDPHEKMKRIAAKRK